MSLGSYKEAESERCVKNRKGVATCRLHVPPETTNPVYDSKHSTLHRTCMHTYAKTCLYVLYTCNTCMHACMHACVQKHMSIYMLYIDIYIHIYVYIDIYLYIYTYIYSYAHTRIHIHIHIYTYVCISIYVCTEVHVYLS